MPTKHDCFKISWTKLLIPVQRAGLERAERDEVVEEEEGEEEALGLFLSRRASLATHMRPSGIGPGVTPPYNGFTRPRGTAARRRRQRKPYWFPYVSLLPPYLQPRQIKSGIKNSLFFLSFFSFSSLAVKICFQTPSLMQINPGVLWPRIRPVFRAFYNYLWSIFFFFFITLIIFFFSFFNTIKTKQYNTSIYSLEQGLNFFECLKSWRRKLFNSKCFS